MTATEFQWSFDMDSAPKDQPVLLSRHSIDGPVVGVWTGAFDDSTWEYPDLGSLPDWWFLHDKDQEIALNPVAWCQIPNFAEAAP